MVSVLLQHYNYYFIIIVDHGLQYDNLKFYFLSQYISKSQTFLYINYEVLKRMTYQWFSTKVNVEIDKKRRMMYDFYEARNCLNSILSFRFLYKNTQEYQVLGPGESAFNRIFLLQFLKYKILHVCIYLKGWTKHTFK